MSLSPGFPLNGNVEVDFRGPPDMASYLHTEVNDSQEDFLFF